jgi:hypothetical protein
MALSGPGLATAPSASGRSTLDGAPRPSNA